MEILDDGRVRFLHRFPFGGSGGTDLYSEYPYDDGGWHHVVIVKAADTVSLYLNGIPVDTSADDSQFDEAVDRVVMGILKHTSSSRYFPGAIDEVYLYNRVLSSAEVTWLSGRTKKFDKP